MTGNALQLCVSAGKRKSCDTVVELGSPTHRIDHVALGAVCRETGRHVVRIFRLPEIGLVTGNAGNGQAAIPPPRSSRMTISASQSGVSAQKWKPRLIVLLPHVRYAPCGRCVTLSAIGAEFSDMSVRMA